MNNRKQNRQEDGNKEWRFQMKQHKSSLLAVLVLVSLLALLFFGCRADVEQRSALTLNLKAEELSRSILPSDTPLEVTKYVISGDGPNDTHFSNVSPKQSLTISGLLIGNWNIHAVGQNSNGTGMVEGEALVQLKPEPTSAEIQLNTLKGTGSMDLTITWDKSLISNPGFELTIIDQNGVISTPTLDVTTLGDGLIHFQGSTFKAGSYQVVGKLLSGMNKTAGFAEAVRIIDGLSSCAEISLNLDKTTTLPSTITLINSVGIPVECSISGLENEMKAGASTVASIATDTQETLDILWYLDGEQVGTGLSYTFAPEMGKHRLDVIAKGPLTASTGSASFPFTAVVKGKAGVPILMKQIADGNDNLFIGGNCQLAFLPDGKIIVASESHQTIQICQLMRNDLQVITTYNSANCNFTCSQISDIAVDSRRNYVYIADNTSPKVTKYSYHSDTSTLSKILETTNHSWESATSFGTYSKIGSMSIDENEGLVYVSTLNQEDDICTIYDGEVNTLSNFIYDSSFWGSEVESYDKTKRFTPRFFNQVIISPDFQYIAAIDRTDNFMCVSPQMNVDRKLTNSYSPCSEFSDDLYGMDNLFTMAFLDGNHVAVGTSNQLSMINGYLKQLGRIVWSDGLTYQSGDAEIGSKQMLQIIQLTNTSDQSRLYVLCKESKNILTFNTPSGTMVYLDETSLGNFDPNELALSSDGETMIVTSKTSDAIQIMRIPLSE